MGLFGGAIALAWSTFPPLELPQAWSGGGQGPTVSTLPPSLHPAQPGTEKRFLGIWEQRGGREEVLHLQYGSLVTKCRILTPCTRPQGPSKSVQLYHLSSLPPQSPCSRLRPPGSQQPLALSPSPAGFAHAFTCLEPSLSPWLTSPPRLSQAPHAPGHPVCPTGLQSNRSPPHASGSRVLQPHGPSSGPNSESISVEEGEVSSTPPFQTGFFVTQSSVE